MRCKTAPPSLETTSEERVAKLASFISHHITVDGASGTGICLIARSSDSPAFKAAVLAADEANGSIPVRALFATADAKVMSQIGQKWEIRVLRTARLLDAHEQLTVGDACWYGDCLRRDPGKRDFYEQFNSNGGQALAWSEISFTRLWALAEPVSTAATETVAADETSSIASISPDASPSGSTQIDAS